MYSAKFDSEHRLSFVDCWLYVSEIEKDADLPKYLVS